MPMKPLKPCSHVGCTKLVAGRYCPGHEADAGVSDKVYDQTRRTGHDFYTSARWQRFRRRVLRGCPICRECSIAVATEVHHLQPVKLDAESKLVLENCVGLCKSCHSRLSTGERIMHGR